MKHQQPSSIESDHDLVQYAFDRMAWYAQEAGGSAARQALLLAKLEIALRPVLADADPARVEYVRSTLHDLRVAIADDSLAEEQEREALALRREADVRRG